MKMRFGAMNFPVRPVLEEIEAIGQLKMDYVELAMDPPQAHYSQLRQERSSIQKILARHDMSLICHLPTFVHIADLTEEIRRVSVKEVIGSLETAADLGAGKVVVHPGLIGGLAVHVLEYAMARSLESLELIYRRAEALGVTLCIENMFPGLGPYVEPEDLKPIFEAMPKMMLALDTGHAHIGDETGRRVVDLITTYAHRLEHVHVSDNSGRLDEHLPLGRGTIGFKKVTDALRKVGYDKMVTLEIFDADRTALVHGRSKLQKLLESV